MMPKYSSGAHDTSSRSTGLSSTKCWNTTRGIAQPHRRYRGLRTVCGDYDTCAIIELNHLEPVFFSHPCAKTPICTETPICAKTPTLFLVGFGYVCTAMFLFVLRVFWCPRMAINVSVQYDGGLLPDIILLTQCYYHWGNHLNAMNMCCLCSL